MCSVGDVAHLVESAAADNRHKPPCPSFEAHLARELADLDDPSVSLVQFSDAAWHAWANELLEADTAGAGLDA